MDIDKMTGSKCRNPLAKQFGKECREWYGLGRQRHHSDARVRVYIRLSKKYGSEAVNRHARRIAGILDRIDFDAGRPQS